ncbi:MAG: 4Fe-4S dicluster domain-containing protein [Caldilineae bacterium]|nr:MAG: 4Fe-4S dicluster domain-containing protein [Caldilineae bacterium]
MQHSIDPASLGSRGPQMAAAVQACVHCGFCLAACPTYRVLGDEMNSPRGRIYLMKTVMEGGLSAEEAAPYVDQCLGCVGCMPACPSGVGYGELLMGYRAWTADRGHRPNGRRLAHTLLVKTLPYPGRFRLAQRAGKVGRFLKGVLPAQLGVMLDMLPDTLPSARPLPEYYPARGRRRARVALLVGCVQSVLAPEINWATLRVLAANGVETVIPRGQGCCGSILMHVGEAGEALRLARNNLRVFPNDVDAVVTNAAGCGSGMHEYPLLFAGEPEEEEVRRWSSKVKDISVFLDELGPVSPPALERPLKAVYQDACHLLHAQGVKEAPRRLLGSIPNLALLELDDGGLCCGSAGVYNLEHPDIAGQLGRRKAEHIEATGAEAVITGNIGCLVQIQKHLRERGRSLPVLHTVQVLDRAYAQG